MYDIAYEKAFEGECKGDPELKMFEGKADNGMNLLDTYSYEKQEDPVGRDKISTETECKQLDGITTAGGKTLIWEGVKDTEGLHQDVTCKNTTMANLVMMNMVRSKNCKAYVYWNKRSNLDCG